MFHSCPVGVLRRRLLHHYLRIFSLLENMPFIVLIVAPVDNDIVMLLLIVILSTFLADLPAV